LGGGKEMSNLLLQACKELIDDAKLSCVDLVFKELCLEILAKARNVLNDAQFEELVKYASDRMAKKAYIKVNTKVK